MSENSPRRLRGRSYAETRSAVLDLIRSSGTISRVELAQQGSLTEATISKIVRELLSEGIIVEDGRGESTGGKRPILLRLTNGGRHAVGLALDHATLVAVLCGLDGSVVDRIDATGAADQSPATVIRRATNMVNKMLRRNGVAADAVIGLGVATGGRRHDPAGWGDGVKLADIWDTVDTATELGRRTGLPVTLENDANCAALGTFWTDKGATGDFLTVYMSSGIGAGIVIGGRLFRGSSGNAGEIGHVVVDPAGRPCWCGAVGCLETVGPPRGVRETVLGDRALRRRFLGVREPGDVGDVELFREITAAALGGDDAATGLLAHSADVVAVVLLGLANTLDLARIQLCGPGFASVGDRYVQALRRRLEASAISRGVHSVTVELGGVGPEVAATGAASVVLHGNLTPHHDAR